MPQFRGLFAFRTPGLGYPLRLQVLFAQAVASLCLMVTLAALLPWMVVTRFDRQEERHMHDDTLRVAQALQTELESLSTYVQNWSNWDDSYQYMFHLTQSYEKSNLVAASFESSRLNLVVFTNTHGEVLTTRAFDLTKGVPVPAAALTDELLRRAGADLKTSGDHDTKQGIVQLTSGPGLFAARPILTSEGKGPSVGTLIMGRLLSKEMLSALKRDTHLSLQIGPASSALTAQVAHTPNGVLVRDLDAERLQGLTIVRELNVQRALALTVGAVREDHANGLHTARIILLAVLAAVLLLTVLSMVLVERLVLNRLDRYREQVRVIMTQGALTTRFPVIGRDELSDLGHALNGLLDQTEFSQRQLHRLATVDELTGLPNRMAFKSALTALIKRAAPFAVVLIDLDNFKAINDTLGHEVGDEVLRGATNHLFRALPPGGLIARLGGDEFAVLLPDGADPAQVEVEARALLSALTPSLPTSAADILVRASAGVSHWPGDDLEPSALLRYADLAMYRAKASGTGIEHYRTSFSAEAHRRSTLERSLHGVLERGELWLAYQPVVELTTGQLVGCEALLRWQSPEHGVVPPAQFISIAEDRGHIQDIGAWVLREACTRAALWNQQGRPFTVAVNVSAVQLRDNHFARGVSEILTATGLPPALLELEVTETAVMASLAQATEQLAQVRAIGVAVALDDFGTGYSSLELVRELPLDKLKLDRSFVLGAEQDTRRQVIVAAIIGLARDLHLQVVAEGVETIQQRDMLLALKCPLAQGYLYASPLHPDELSNLMHTSQTRVVNRLSYRATAKAGP